MTEKLLSYYKVKEFSSLLVCFAFIFCRVMTLIRHIGVIITKREDVPKQNFNCSLNVSVKL